MGMGMGIRKKRVFFGGTGMGMGTGMGIIFTFGTGMGMGTGMQESVLPQVWYGY